MPIVNDNQCVRKINAVTEKIFILPASSFCAGGEEAHDACQVTRTMLNSEMVKISNLRDLLQKIVAIFAFKIPNIVRFFSLAKKV